MTQRFEKLRKTIAEVEQELASAETLDTSTRQSLEQAIEDLQEALDRQGGPGPFEPESLIERFRETEENFQVSHPTLSGMVTRVIDMLGQLGI